MTVGKRGRPRNYKTPAAFRKAVETYFDVITRERKLTEWVDSGERTNKGKPIMVERDVLGLDGQPVMIAEYITPPSLTSLMVTIGIKSKATWHDYKQRDGYREVCEEAKLLCESYLEEQAIIRDNPRGVLQNLMSNYGWTQSKEVELGRETRAALAMDMTMEEKMRLIREMAVAAGDTDEGEESGD